MPTPKKGWELAPARLAQLRKNLKALGADDNALSGWHAEEKERQGGESAGFRDAEFVSPSNKRFRSQTAVERHLGLDSDAKPKPKAAPKVKATAKPPDETASKRARPPGTLQLALSAAGLRCVRLSLCGCVWVRGCVRP